ncbi:aminotransferase class V-fold PLP-dependent enzyme, partial [bacterium]|nr:aminotransferase class V-fold PLP-dependent enzyme [bacterium]
MAGPLAGRRPPRLGRAARGEWTLDPEAVFLNHGSFGAAPRFVQEAQSAWRERMERQPVQFLARDIWDNLLHEAADSLAGFLGARGEDLVFVDNATAGVNTVLKGLALAPGDEVLGTDHAYGAIWDTIRFVAARAGAKAVRAKVGYPPRGDDEMVAAVMAAVTPRTRVAVLDHVSSDTGLIWPIERLVAACRERSVPVLVDGAHAPGMLDLAIPPIGADWYTGNCHKWLCAPKGSAFLWTKPERQAETHPLVTSFGHGWGSGYRGEFLWVGTRDYTPFLTVPAALEFHAWLGGGVRAYQQSLAEEARRLLAEAWSVPAEAPAATVTAVVKSRMLTSGLTTRLIRPLSRTVG